MALPEIVIGSKFDAKGFKQAETATDKLGKSIKNLAYSFGLVFSAQKLVSFGKASVKAFAADENAARSLGMTLKNLNLDYFGASAAVICTFQTLKNKLVYLMMNFVRLWIDYLEQLVQLLIRRNFSILL
jgi:hypothetical protein